MATRKSRGKLNYGLMTNIRGLCWLVGLLICVLPVELGSEDMTLSTYYPAPLGVYTQLLTTQETILARDGGNVGIGTSNPGQELDVVGNVKMNTAVLSPQDAPPGSPQDGMMYINSGDGEIYRYWKGNWGRVLSAKDQLVGERILSGNWWFTGNWKTIDGLRITERTPQRGLYSVTWGGQVKIDAKPGKKVKIKVRYGDTTIIYNEYGDDDGDKDGAFTYHDIGGSTLLQLKRDRNYKVRINGYRSGGAAKNESVAISGMWIRMSLVFAL